MGLASECGWYTQWNYCRKVIFFLSQQVSIANSFLGRGLIKTHRCVLNLWLSLKANTVALTLKKLFSKCFLKCLNTCHLRALWIAIDVLRITHSIDGWGHTAWPFSQGVLFLNESHALMLSGFWVFCFCFALRFFGVFFLCCLLMTSSFDFI